MTAGFAAGGRVGRSVVPTCLLLLLLVAVRLTGLARYFGLDGLSQSRDRIDDFGSAAPAVFALPCAVASVALVPGVPLSLLAGLLFGPVWGALWTVIGATFGTTLAFLIGGYAGA